MPTGITVGRIDSCRLLPKTNNLLLAKRGESIDHVMVAIVPMIKLHRQVCAFIDVLGGADLFRGKDRERASEFFELLRDFERRLNLWSHHFPKKRQSSSLVKTFSDNIFAAFPLRSSSKADDEDVVGLFLVELVIQVQQITKLGGFPLRGAVTVGSLLFTDQYLFGPALVETVALEKEALFPRVLVSKAVLRYIKPDNPRSLLLLRDSDGQTFLDYLGNETHLGWHREYVERGLRENANRVRVRQKYEWLARYHNYCVHRNGGNRDLYVSLETKEQFNALFKTAKGVAT